MLIALMTPALAMHVGEPNSAALAQAGTAHDALADLEDGGVPAGVLTPINILTTDAQARDVADWVKGQPAVRAVLDPGAGGNRRDGTALVTVLPSEETSTTSWQQTLEQIHAELAAVPGVLGVAGSGAAAIDFAQDVYGGFPAMLALIALVTFLVLARSFRSWLLPLKAVLLNLASLAAAYGVMVLIWQVGGISDALWGIPATGAITTWVPVMVFAFLFGLSMDYEVFILARMRDTFDTNGSTQDAVITGIGRTGRW